MGRHIVFSSVVCLSVRPSVRLSLRHTFLSPIYLLNPWWDLQITLYKCQVWWDDVQCLTKVGSRSRSQFKIKYCMTVFRVRSISFERLVGFTKNVAQMSSMTRQCAMQCLTTVGSRSRSQFKIKYCITVFRVRSISFEPLVGFTNHFAHMSCMMRRCAVPMFDQGRSRSRSQFKIKYCMTVFRVRIISFEPLVGFTNNFAQMSSMVRRCAMPMFDQGRFRVKVTI